MGVFLGMKVGYELGDGETVRGIPMNYFHGREKESQKAVDTYLRSNSGKWSQSQHSDEFLRQGKASSIPSLPTPHTCMYFQEATPDL